MRGCDHARPSIAVAAHVAWISTPANPYDVAIVGGGAAGVLVAIHLLSGRAPPLRVAIVEPRPVLAQGGAYSTDNPAHLLNVVAGRMSAFDADPGHFIRYLQAEGGDGLQGLDAATLSTTFVPRRVYGRYLAATLQAQPHAAALRRVQDEAVDLQGDGDGGYTVHLRLGEPLHARRVVLAIGNVAGALPLPASAIHGLPRLLDAWDHAALQGIDPAADVCIVGAGLSMVDVVAGLAARGHRGRIGVVSRHGLVPLAHAVPGLQEGEVDALLGQGVRATLRALRRRAAAAQAAGEPWQWVMDRLRHHGQALWQHLDVAEQRRFLRHAARFWDVHRHRIAPQVAAAVEGLRASGQLRVMAGRLAAIDGDAGRATVRVQLRGGKGEHAFVADCVVNATGVETGLLRTQSVLLQALAQRGLVVPGPHGIGMATDAAGGLVDAQGGALPGLWTLGASRIGSLWESIAIPELRGQAREVAAGVTASLRSR